MKKENIKESDLAEFFIKGFVESIIENKIKENFTPLQMQGKNMAKPKADNIKIKNYSLESLESKTEDKSIKLDQHTPPIMKQNISNISNVNPVLSIAEKKPMNIRTGPLLNLSGTPLNKLLPFLNDPSIWAIECQGPGKNIHIIRGGAKHITPLILDSSEIDDIMREISGRTKIPLIQGMFKAAFGNLLISAVISEFVGTHFSIKKIASPRPPYPLMRR